MLKGNAQASAPIRKSGVASLRQVHDSCEQGHNTVSKGDTAENL